MLQRRVLSIILCFAMFQVRLAVAGPLDFTVQSNNQNGITVPEFGGQVGLIDKQKEQQLGEKVLLQVRAELPILDDPWLEDQMMGLFGRIYQQTGLGKPLALVLIRDQQVNAFAVPGGVFAINSGTIQSAKNLDEIAAVMAHETAHVSQRHFSRSQDAFKNQAWLNIAALLAGIAVSSKSPEAGAAVMMGGQAALLDKQLAYSRNQEREADRVGMQYLSVAGYNPEAMADFFETMQRSRSQVSVLPDFWLTHPLTSERMSEARLRARQFVYSPQQNGTQNNLFDYIRWRSLVRSGATDVAHLKTAAERNPAAALAWVSYHIDQAQYDDAYRILSLLNNTPKDLTALTWADYYLAIKQPDKALPYVQPLAAVLPENRALQLKLADVLIAQKRNQDANQLLKALSLQYPRDAKVWQRLMQAEQGKPSPLQTVNVLRYRAETQFWSGDIEHAILSLLQAQRLKPQSDMIRQHIESRLSAMQRTYQFRL